MSEKRELADSLDKADVEQKEVIEQDETTLETFVISSQKERKLVRKLDKRILLIIYTLYLFACEFLKLLTYPELGLNITHDQSSTVQI